MAFASTEIIAVLNKIKYPYNVNIFTQKQALRALDKASTVKDWVDTLLSERERLSKLLSKLGTVKHIYPSDANFLLVKFDDANAIYRYLVNSSIIVRNRNSVSLCYGCIRITVGTPEENDTLIKTLENYR